MKLQNQNQVRGASDPEKLFANSNTERKKRVQSSNQAVQFPDSFLYFRIQQPRNSFILWERGELGHSNKSASVSSVLVLSSQLHTMLMMNIEHNTHDDSKVLKYSTFHALLLVVALWFFGKLRSKAKKKAPGPVNNVYRKKVRERERESWVWICTEYKRVLGSAIVLLCIVFKCVLWWCTGWGGW